MNQEYQKFVLIDSHAHLDMQAFDSDRDKLLVDLKQAGIGVLTVGIDCFTSQAAVSLANENPHLWAAAGIHPHEAGRVKDGDWTRMESLWSLPKVVAVGEVGLDFFRDYSPRETQVAVFRYQLERAVALKKPIIVHSRSAMDDVKENLALFPQLHGVIHCFSGDEADADYFCQAGYYISIPGTVTYKNADMVRRVARTVPLDRLLIETDCPYLSPEPYRGRRNDPRMVRLTAEAIAQLRGIPTEALADATIRNFFQLFGKKDQQILDQNSGNHSPL